MASSQKTSQTITEKKDTPYKRNLEIKVSVGQHPMRILTRDKQYHTNEINIPLGSVMRTDTVVIQFFDKLDLMK